LVHNEKKGGSWERRVPLVTDQRVKKQKRGGPDPFDGRKTGGKKGTRHPPTLSLGDGRRSGFEQGGRMQKVPAGGRGT